MVIKLVEHAQLDQVEVAPEVILVLEAPVAV
jgi:hypothetical protein